jgi:DNA-binding MarR family transcriptional regulator
MPSNAVAARTLIEVAVDLRRVLRRHLPQDLPDATLTPAQAEVIRDVDRHPGTRVKETAGRLNVAQNTVSTIVRKLSDMGLLERRTDERDRRAVALFVAPGRAERRQRRADQRTVVLAMAIDGLDPEERQVLVDALPVMQRLVVAVRDAPAPRRRRQVSDSAPDDLALGDGSGDVREPL